MREYIKHLMVEIKGRDKSFTGNTNDGIFGFLFGNDKYSNEEVRKIWLEGIEHGLEIGLNKARLDGQVIELNSNVTDERHKEFLEKFFRLADEYQCAIQHHPEVGMVVIDTENENNR